MTEPTTFKISWNDNAVEVEGRQAAVDFAKAKSLEVAPTSVNVDSIGDEKSSSVSMTYHSGSLEVYVAETRSPERRTRKRDRSEEEQAEKTEGAEAAAPAEAQAEASAEAQAEA